MAAEEARQTPCPDRILDDLGSAFAMGCIGGGVWHGVKGMRNSPRGDRLRGGFGSMAQRAPSLGGSFAVWGGLFATFDCTYAHLRRREDPWNSIAAGATTGGILAARAGVKAMGTNAVIGGVLLAVIEGLGVCMQKMMAPPEQQGLLPPPSQAPAGTRGNMPGAAPGVGEMMNDMGSNTNAPPAPTFSPDDEEEADMFAGGFSSDTEADFAFGEMSDDDEDKF